LAGRSKQQLAAKPSGPSSGSPAYPLQFQYYPMVPRRQRKTPLKPVKNPFQRAQGMLATGRVPGSAQGAYGELPGGPVGQEAPAEHKQPPWTAPISLLLEAQSADEGCPEALEFLNQNSRPVKGPHVPVQMIFGSAASTPRDAQAHIFSVRHANEHKLATYSREFTQSAPVNRLRQMLEDLATQD
jgi:hypothetical protein